MEEVVNMFCNLDSSYAVLLPLSLSSPTSRRDSWRARVACSSMTSKTTHFRTFEFPLPSFAPSNFDNSTTGNDDRRPLNSARASRSSLERSNRRIE